MPIQIAVVGPGRLGRALARRWREAGFAFRGFLGRDPARVAEALRFVGGGAALEFEHLHAAQVVVLAVPDSVIAPLAADLASRRAVRSCALVFHLAGAVGRDALAPLASSCGARTAAMQPLVPVPDAGAGYHALPGRFALCETGANGARLLALLARRAGLRPVCAGGPIDRDAYHAACALAANGGTALCAVAARTLSRALQVDRGEAETLIADLAGSALGLCAERGATLALSGPVVRGDVERVRSHLSALGATGDGGVAVYRSLMHEALALAVERGLPVQTAARIGALLGEDADA